MQMLVTTTGVWATRTAAQAGNVSSRSRNLGLAEAQFTALRHFCLAGTDHESHEAQAFLIRRYIAWRNRHAQDRMLREVVKRANVA